MAERKSTDEEVIKALQVCVANDSCKECPINPNHGNYRYCTNLALTYALDLINRQRAEIERLQTAANNAVRCFTRLETIYKIKCKQLETAKAEAIKEFAERLKERFFNYYEGLNANTSKSNYHGETLMFYEVADMIENCIENLVEEMTEGKPCTDGADCSTCENCYHDGGYNECATDGVKL